MPKGRKARPNGENGANLGFEAKLWAIAYARSNNNMDIALRSVHNGANSINSIASITRRFGVI